MVVHCYFKHLLHQTSHDATTFVTSEYSVVGNDTQHTRPWTSNFPNWNNRISPSGTKGYNFTEGNQEVLCVRRRRSRDLFPKESGRADTEKSIHITEDALGSLVVYLQDGFVVCYRRYSVPQNIFSV